MSEKEGCIARYLNGPKECEENWCEAKWCKFNPEYEEPEDE